jgi:hypothetical protein
VATGSARRRARGRPRGRVATSSCAPPPARSVQPKVKTKISSGAKGSADVPCLADSGDKAGGLVLMGCLSDNFSWTADLLATPHPPSRSAASISSSPPPPPPHSVPGRRRPRLSPCLCRPPLIGPRDATDGRRHPARQEAARSPGPPPSASLLRDHVHARFPAIRHPRKVCVPHPSRILSRSCGCLSDLAIPSRTPIRNRTPAPTTVRKLDSSTRIRTRDRSI